MVMFGLNSASPVFQSRQILSKCMTWLHLFLLKNRNLALKNPRKVSWSEKLGFSDFGAPFQGGRGTQKTQLKSADDIRKTQINIASNIYEVYVLIHIVITLKFLSEATISFSVLLFHHIFCLSK